MSHFKKENFQQVVIGFFVFIFFVLSVYFGKIYNPPRIVIDKQSESLNFHEHFLKFISMGNSRLISSYLWIQTLLEADLEHYSGQDLNNWMFTRFKTISNLEPKFREVYTFGGVYLSVIKDDSIGAKYIFDKGLSFYPDDFDLNYFGGLHYYYELNDSAGASALLSKVMYHPKAPKNLPSIVAKLNSNVGDLENAYNILKDAISRITETNSFFRSKFEESLKSLQIEIDLKCLNSGERNCSLNPPEGYKYLKNGQGQYMTNLPYKKFELYQNKNIK